MENEVKKYGDFRDLEVWQQCRIIRAEIWNLCKNFPKEEKYRLSDQMIRSSRSSTDCIAEGYGTDTIIRKISNFADNQGDPFMNL